MCGTPSASRAILTGRETGAVTVPEISGSTRYANQYTAMAATTSAIPIAMLT
jgi:hypothetical protein